MAQDGLRHLGHEGRRRRFHGDGERRLRRDSAEQFLVGKLNEKDGAGTWAFIDADARTGQQDALGNDAIKVGMLYKPASVTPVGTTAALNGIDFVNAGDSGPRNRPSLAQAFRDNSTAARSSPSRTTSRARAVPATSPTRATARATATTCARARPSSSRTGSPRTRRAPVTLTSSSSAT